MVHSAIGTRHEKRGQPCQDYGNYRFEEPYLIGAVSDGAGSAKYSDAGSQIAVESALESITKILKRQFIQVPSRENIEQAAPEIFDQMLEDILCTLHQEAITSGCELRDLGCTLLVFFATPNWVAAMQIGDGLMMLRAHADAPYQLLFKPDKGEFINETIFITTPRASNYMSVCVEAVEAPFLCAATDGLERVAVRLQDWEPFAPFFRPFEDCLTKIPTEAEQQTYLKTFLESARLNAKTDDDKTMLVCLYCTQPEEP
jgi:Protein phosphatase 2C